MFRYLGLAICAVLVFAPALNVKAQQLVSYHKETKTLSTPPKDNAYKYLITVYEFPSEGDDVEKIQIFGGILDAAVIRLICHHVSLKEVVLPDSNLGDGDLAAILAHTNCEFLNVAGTDITNTSVMPLVNERSIKKLYISNSGINPEGRAKLKQLRPDLKLD
jgi:hypothetical protein